MLLTKSECAYLDEMKLPSRTLKERTGKWSEWLSLRQKKQKSLGLEQEGERQTVSRGYDSWAGQYACPYIIKRFYIYPQEAE